MFNLVNIMSRLGKKPIEIPQGVEVTMEGKKVFVKGPKGSLDLDVLDAIDVKVEDGKIFVSRVNELDNGKAYQGLTRSLINNMVIGVTDGYKKELEMKGIGYKATLQGEDMVLNIGYSHPIVVKAPDGIKFTVVDGLNITIEGVDKHLVGQIAANIREHRKPEPYKGKGIKYKDEIIRRKSGKAKAKVG